MISKTKLAVISGIFIILAAIIGIFPWICGQFDWCNGNPLEVKITYPTDGDRVPNFITVKGTTNRDIQANDFLWLFVGLDEVNQWWPQGGGNIFPIEGKWSKEARIGAGPDLDIDRPFQIAVLSVGKIENEELNLWVEKGNETHEYPPFKLPLQTGTMLDRITVVRGKGDKTLA